MKKIRKVIITLLVLSSFFISSGVSATSDYASDNTLYGNTNEVGGYEEVTVKTKTTKKKKAKKKTTKKKSSTKKSTSTNKSTTSTTTNTTNGSTSQSGVLTTDCEANPELCEGIGNVTTTEISGKTITTKTSASSEKKSPTTGTNGGSTGTASTNATENAANTGASAGSTTTSGTSKGGSTSTATSSGSTGGTSNTGSSSSTNSTNTNNDVDISSFNAENCYGFGDVIYFATLFVRILQIVAPILLVIWASIDLFKSVIANDEKKIIEMRKPIIGRFIAAIVIFLVPWIVYTIVNSFGSNAAWLNCWKTYGYKRSK